MTNWQPIETAPLDGTSVLVWDGRSVSSARAFPNEWDNRGDECGWSWCPSENSFDSSPHGIGEPTHWMPLPEPPASDNK